MASQSIRFDFLTSGADKLARDFKNTGDNAAAAARGAKVLSSTIEQLGQKENRTAAESATLAKALKLTGDAEDRAAAKALAADIAIRRLDDAMADSSKSTSRAGGGFLGLTGAVTGFSDASTAASGDSTTFQKALAGINLATGVLEPALAGVVVAVGGLAAGFAAAGAGLGVFGIVAQSVFSEASKAATTYATAQAKYDSATTSAQRTSALKAEKAAFQGLTPPVKTLAVELGNVQNKWKAFTDAAAPGVVSVITQGLGLLPKVLAAMKPFLAPVEAALHGIITQLATGLNSSGFKSFIDLLAKNTGPAITKIAAAIGNVIVGIGGILKAFLPTSQSLLSGVDKITAKFREWGTTLSAGTGFQSLMATFKTETPQAVAILKNLGVVLLNVGKAVTGLSGVGNSKTLLQALLPLSGVLASLSKNTDLDRIVLYLIAARSAAVKLGPAFLGIKAAVSFFPSAWAAIVKFSGAVEGAAAKEVIAGAAAKVWAGAQAVLNAVMDANPIVLVAAAVAALAAGFVIAWKKSSLFRDIIKDIGKVFLQFGILWVQETKIIVDTFLNMVGIVIRGAADAFGWVPGLGGKLKGASTAFTNWKNSVSGDLDKVIGNMRGWQKELDASKRTTDAATSAIVRDMTRAGGSAVVARDDVATYTRAVQDNGAKSNAARSARANLIRDLENAGVHAGTANRLVNNLQGAINKMHGKTVSVGVHGTGSGGVQVTPSSGIPGAKNFAAYFKPLAAGGRIPGFGGGDQHPALLESGEAVVDKNRTRRFAPVLKAMGVPGMASGGLVGAVGSIGAAGAADGASGVRADISAYVAYLKKLAAQFVATLVPNVGSGVARWKGTVDKALRLEGLSTAFDSRVLYQMQTESGGNPNAINLTDINAQHGDPSRGLMQVIGSTFRAYHWPGTSSNIYDPLANIAAAINYARHVYGPQLGNQYGGIGSGHGYALGTASATPGWAWVGERGPELVRFRGGEQVRPAQAIPGGTAGGGVHLHLTVNGPIGSQQQLEDWYVRTANKLAQHGRLTQAVKTASR